jgi:hypothetical protein
MSLSRRGSTKLGLILSFLVLAWSLYLVSAPRVAPQPEASVTVDDYLNYIDDYSVKWGNRHLSFSEQCCFRRRYYRLQAQGRLPSMI